MIKIRKIYKNGSGINNNTRRVPSEGILVSMTVDFNVESNGYEIFRSWPVFFLFIIRSVLVNSIIQERKKERNLHPELDRVSVESGNRGFHLQYSMIMHQEPN